MVIRRSSKMLPDAFGSAVEPLLTMTTPQGSVIDPGQPINLFESESISGKESPARLFFPCNREDSLLLLGSLGLSQLFPGELSALALQGGEIALVESGLRSSEEDLVAGGVQERFPLLVELDHEVLALRPRLIEMRHVRGLRFRSEKELQDFRYRPIDEFDTECLPASAEPNLFSREGKPRFTLADPLNPEALALGRLADRLVSGIRCLLELGEAHSECWDVIGKLLSDVHGVVDAEGGFGIRGVIRMAMDPAHSKEARHARAVVKTFLEMERPSARKLVDGIHAELLVHEADEQTRRVEVAWRDRAHDVLANRLPLDGELLRDEKAIILRSALLAAAVDEPSQLAKFLDAEKPSGLSVTTIAAFLMGLKRGLLDTPWARKKGHQVKLSHMLATAQASLLTGLPVFPELFSHSRRESDDSIEYMITFDKELLATWSRRRATPPDADDKRWLARFSELGYEGVRQGEFPHSWRIPLSDTFNVEVSRGGSGDREFPILRFPLDGQGKLKKPKDLAEVSFNHGNFWHLGATESGFPALFCHLLDLPDVTGKALLASRLSELITLCVAPKRAKATPTPGGAAKKKGDAKKALPPPISEESGKLSVVGNEDGPLVSG